MASIGADPSRGKMFITKIDILRGPPLLSEGNLWGAIHEVRECSSGNPQITLNGCPYHFKAFLFKSH